MKRCCLVPFLVALLFVSTALANTTYTVKKGDTLQKISKKYDIHAADIKRANNLKSCRLSAGMKLVIPQKKGSPEKPSQHENALTHYTVKKGDSLKTIAKRHEMTTAELRKINNLKKGRLKVGQQLLVKNPDPKVYTAKKGDTLNKIAKKFKVSVNELKEINGLQNKPLRPGQKICLARKAPAPKPEPKEEGPFLVSLPDGQPASAKLEEVKELSKSEDILTELSVKERLILFAKKMLHLPYRFGGNGAFGLDCSSYVQKVYGFIGQKIPRSAREQFNVGEAVEKKDLSVGDLVFFKTYASFPSHVGIYLGNNLFIHASSLSKKITIDSLESPYYFKRFIGAKRVLAQENDEDAEPDDDLPAKEN